jgi:signal transduction histidine kinase
MQLVTPYPLWGIFAALALLLVCIVISFLLFYEKRVSRILRKQFEISREEYDERTQKKSEFMSFATHQLRSPLTALSWGIDALLDDKAHFSQNQIGVLEKMRLTAKELVETVNDLLDVSLIEQGGMRLTRTTTDIGVMVSLIADTLRPLAEKKSLTVTMESVLPGIMVLGDQVKLRQVFMNIIENAIKYTDTGGIFISVSVARNSANIVIKDTGRGISEEDQKNLFRKFERGSMKTSDHPGSGLGLYLSKQIIELHGGTITLASPGVSYGTTVTVTLPVSL